MAPVTPVKAEAIGTPVQFEYDGDTYAVAPANEWDLDVLEAFEEGRILATVRSLLGEAQWKTFRAKPRNVQALADLFEALQAALGISGN